jgi:hypothetical protein
METLYDLLGALPRDDAEGLRAAFRRAVKGAHPDLNPGDPDAALKFRQIVRANELLADVEQRAAYDHLLELARLEQAQASRRVAAHTIYKVASAVIALSAAVAAAAGLYLLSMNLPGSVFPSANGAGIATGDQAAAITETIQPFPVRTQSIAPAAMALPSEAAAIPPARIGPPLDISPKAASLNRAPADIARAKRIERARRAAALARARKRRLARAAIDSRARAAQRRRMAQVALSRQEWLRSPRQP